MIYFRSMSNDHRYRDLKIRINAGDATEFRQIFETVPKTVIGHELLKNPGRMDDLMENPEKVTAKDIYKMSQLIKVAPAVILQMILTQYLKNNDKNRL
jgi:hypothetical protein